MASGSMEYAEAHKFYELQMDKKVFSIKNIHVIFNMARHFKREQYDLISVHTTLAAALCRVALSLAQVSKTRLSYTCHGYFFNVDAKNRVVKSPQSLFYLVCEKLMANTTDLLLLMNWQDFESAKRYKLSNHIDFIFGMGIAPRRYAVSEAWEAKRAKEALSIGAEDVVFLCVGEFSKRKNQRQILNAFSQLQKHLPKTVLVFAGDGGRLQACKDKAGALGLDGRVIFCGYVREMRKLYAAADVLVSASRCEGLPFCVLEGLLFGLPVIASRIKGHTDLVQNEYNGLLYDARSTAQLSAHMRRLAGDVEYRLKLRGNASLPRQYDLDTVKPRMIGLLDKCLPGQHTVGQEDMEAAEKVGGIV